MKRASLTEWSIVIAFSIGVGIIVWTAAYALKTALVAVLS